MAMFIRFVKKKTKDDKLMLIQRFSRPDIFQQHRCERSKWSNLKLVSRLKAELFFLRIENRKIFIDSSLGDDFNVIQQEIVMMLQCTHPNIIAYFGSYLKFVDSIWKRQIHRFESRFSLDEINCGSQWNFALVVRCKIFITVRFELIRCRKRKEPFLSIRTFSVRTIEWNSDRLHSTRNIERSRLSTQKWQNASRRQGDWKRQGQKRFSRHLSIVRLFRAPIFC